MESLFQVRWRLPRVHLPRVLPQLYLPGPVTLRVVVISGVIWLAVAASVVAAAVVVLLVGGQA